jgi:hypothetical protein
MSVLVCEKNSGSGLSAESSAFISELCSHTTYLRVSEYIQNDPSREREFTRPRPRECDKHQPAGGGPDTPNCTRAHWKVLRNS